MLNMFKGPWLNLKGGREGGEGVCLVYFLREVPCRIQSFQSCEPPNMLWNAPRQPVALEVKELQCRENESCLGKKIMGATYQEVLRCFMS